MTTVLHFIALCFAVICLPHVALCGGGKGGDPADMDPMDLGWSLGVAFVCCAILGGILYALANHNQRIQAAH
jgi:hypothetical protein